MIGILYNAIMHNMEFGQAYCKYFLKRNPKKFNLYFYDFTNILHEFGWCSSHRGHGRRGPGRWPSWVGGSQGEHVGHGREEGAHRCASAPTRWWKKGGPTAFVASEDPAMVSDGRGLLLQVEGDEREEARPFDLSKNTLGGVSPRRGRRRRSDTISDGGNDSGCWWLRQGVRGGRRMGRCAVQSKENEA
jgi:hypothetical protein